MYTMYVAWVRETQLMAALLLVVGGPAILYRCRNVAWAQDDSDDPNISILGGSSTLENGSEVVLLCRTTARTQASFTWMINSQPSGVYLMDDHIESNGSCSQLSFVAAPYAFKSLCEVKVTCLSLLSTRPSTIQLHIEGVFAKPDNVTQQSINTSYVNITWNRVDLKWVAHYIICDNTSRPCANTTEPYYVYAWPQTDPVNVSIAAINGSCLGEPVWVLLLENNEEDGHTTEVRHNGDNGSSSLSGDAIAGISVGTSIFIIALIAMVILILSCCWYWKIKVKKAKKESEYRRQANQSNITDDGAGDEVVENDGVGRRELKGPYRRR